MDDATALLVLPPSTLINRHRLFSPDQGHHHFPCKSSTSGRITFPRKSSPSSPFAAAAAAAMSSASLAPLGNPMSLYDLLRVKRNASMMDIKKAYRNLAKLYHPDSSSHSADGWDFMAIRDAYATLSDPAARALYDLSINVGHHSGRRIGNLAGNGYQRGWRWETDQCW